MNITHETALFIGAWFVQMGAHEGAHAYAAHYLGDDTAYLLGKRSFNPLAHIEWQKINSVLFCVVCPIATTLTMGFPLGMAWVPVNPRRLKKWRRDMALVSFAGPAANLAVVAACLVVHLILSQFPLVPLDMAENVPLTLGGILWMFDEFARVICITSALYGFFNLIPLPPLDGSKILHFFLPPGGRDIMDRIEPYGMMIIFVLFWIGDASIIIYIPVIGTMLLWGLIG